MSDPSDFRMAEAARLLRIPKHIFLARVIQKGTQSLVLRSTSGAPLWLAGARAMGVQKTEQREGAR